MAQPTYECQKCGATVESSDKVCPNGHDLSKVGRKIKLTLEEAISVSTRLSLSSASTSTTVSEVMNSIQTSTTLPPQAKDEYLEKMDEIMTELRKYQEYFEANEKLLKDIDNQTEPKEGLDYWYEQIKSNIIGFVIGLILGWVLQVLT